MQGQASPWAFSLRRVYKTNLIGPGFLPENRIIYILGYMIGLKRKNDRRPSVGDIITSFFIC